MKKLKLLLLITIPHFLLGEDSYNRPGGIADNFTSGMKGSIVSFVDTFYGIFFFFGLIMLAYTIYSAFLDDSQQKKGQGVGGIFWDIFLFILSFVLILSKQFVAWLMG